MSASTRWLRLLWPEIVFGLLWLLLLVLAHTLFTDDDMWQHRAVDILQWAVFAGYVAGATTAHRRLARSPDLTDRA
jgi:hypothetical protein